MRKKSLLVFLLALLSLSVVVVAAIPDEGVSTDEQEQQEHAQEEAAVLEEKSDTPETKAEEDGYIHLVIRRKFANKTFFAMIPFLVQVQIYNLGTATAKNVKVVDTYPDTFTDFIEEYTFDKIPPNDFVSRDYWMTPVFPGKVTIPRIAYTYGGNNDEEEEEGTFSGVRGYGDVEVEAVVETLKEYYIRTAPHGMDWVIVLSSSILACVLPFILWRKN